jgi:hypothetical protein
LGLSICVSSVHLILGLVLALAHAQRGGTADDRRLGRNRRRRSDDALSQARASSSRRGKGVGADSKESNEDLVHCYWSEF